MKRYLIRFFYALKSIKIQLKDKDSNAPPNGKSYTSPKEQDLSHQELQQLSKKLEEDRSSSLFPFRLGL